MNFLFLIKCFLIGVTASSAVGPVFVLTFNRGAQHGFFKGFATAIGSALVDGIFFTLGLLGALKLIEGSKQAILLMDCIGGVTLILLGLHTIKKRIKKEKESNQASSTNISLIRTMAKSFLITFINPFVVLFFMFASVQVLPEGISRLSLSSVLIGSLFVTCGSCTILSIIALIASFVGRAISTRKLNTIAHATGIIFVGAGAYFLIDFFVNLIRL